MLYLIMTFVIPLWVRKIKSKIRSRSTRLRINFGEASE